VPMSYFYKSVLMTLAGVSMDIKDTRAFIFASIKRCVSQRTSNNELRTQDNDPMKLGSWRKHVDAKKHGMDDGAAVNNAVHDVTYQRNNFRDEPRDEEDVKRLFAQTKKAWAETARKCASDDFAKVAGTMNMPDGSFARLYAYCCGVVDVMASWIFWRGPPKQVERAPVAAFKKGVEVGYKILWNTNYCTPSDKELEIASTYAYCVEIMSQTSCIKVEERLGLRQ